MAEERGRRWIFLRGLAREARHWHPLDSMFAQEFPQDEVHKIDLPGAGQFNDLQSPVSVSGILDFVRGEAHRNQLLDRPIFIMSISLGGMVAMDWLHRFPAEVAGAVIMNSSANSPFYWRLRWQVWFDVLAKMTFQRGAERERAVVELVSNKSAIYDDMAKRWAEISSDRPVSTKNTLRQIVAAANFKMPEKPPETPVLALVGDGDRMVDPRCSERWTSLWGLPLRHHPWAGHNLSSDDPDWVLSETKEWLAQL